MSQAKITMLREQVKRAGDALTAIMNDVTEDIAHWQPGGRANSIAANAAHVIFAIDGVVNGLLKGERPLAMGMPHGLSEPPPTGDDRFNWYEWGTGLKVDLPQWREYTGAVLGSVDDYLADLADDDLERGLESAVGQRTVFDMINGPVLFNLNWHAGEISALKGQQGMKGYPF